MISTTPYLIRAIFDWCADQGFTPHLLVDTLVEEVVVPEHLIENGTIILNIQPTAVRNLDLGNEWILFNARFSGQPMDINIPISAVRAVFAKENGLGCAFEPEVELSPEQAAEAMEEVNSALKSEAAIKKRTTPKKSANVKSISSKKAHLKLVD